MKKYLFYGLFALITGFLLPSCQNSGKDNGGNKADRPIALSHSGNKASCVFVTRDQFNLPLMSWVETDKSGKKFLFFSRWNVSMGKFDDPMPIPMEQTAAVHEEGMPKMAVKGDGTLFVLYESSIPHEGSHWGIGDLRYEQSFDGGHTWTQPQSVTSDVKQNLSSNFSGIGRLADGEIGITWLGSVPDGKARPVKFIKTIGRDSFSKEVVVADGACECCRTVVTSGNDGKIYVVYRDLLPGEIRDISVSSSADNGLTFSKPVSFSNDQWSIDGCPHDGPSAINAQGKTYVSWFTGSAKDKGINFAVLNELNKEELRFSIDTNGHFTQMNLLDNSIPLIAYNQDYEEKGNSYSRIMLCRIDNGKLKKEEISAPKTNSSYPVLQPLDKRTVLVAWKNNDRIEYRLVKVYSSETMVAQK